MKPLEAMMDELEGLIPDYEKTNTSISATSVGWHIAHSFMVLERMSMSVAQSDAAQFKKPSFSFKKWVVMLLGRIPRGRGKAPATVVPTETITLQIINERLASAKRAIEEMKTANEHGFMTHPIFGILNKKETLRFMQIHSHHHIAIAKEIIK